MRSELHHSGKHRSLFAMSVYGERDVFGICVLTASYDTQYGEYYPDPPYDRGLILSQGWEAFGDGIPKSACPYTFATIYWVDWCDGWDEAQKELAVGQ